MGDTESTKNTDPALVGWSKDEKFDLLQCIKTKGSRDIQAIHELIPSKTTEQIELALIYYKSKALKNSSRNKVGRPKNDLNLKPSLPLSQWANLLTDNIEFENLQTEIATALRLIAEFEVIPDALSTNFVDFRKAYHMLANAVEGKDLQEDKFLTMLITKSIVETVLTSKVFLQNTTVKQLVENIEIKSERDVKSLKRPVTNKELKIIQHFAEQKNYNPLDIPEHFLRAARE